LVELSVFADPDVNESLCPPVEEELSTGDVGELGSFSLVFFFFRNPRLGMGALVYDD